jgi:glycosyltransferase involved in cell wall biosynthesis
LNANNPLISVIIPAWNREQYLGAALDSVFAQGRDDLEILVVDDGSTDGTVAVAQSRPGVRVVSQQREGPGAARNRGIAETRGELIAFLDSDDWWEPDKLSRQLAALESQPTAGMVLCHVRNVLGAGHTRPGWLRASQLDVEPNYWLLQASLIRREVFARLGPLKTERMLGDDVDWFMRARAAGIETIVLDDILVNRRIHPDNLTATETLEEGCDIRLTSLKALIDARRSAAQS